MPLVVCQERDELEKHINALLRRLSENSTRAADIAQRTGPESSAVFNALHNADSLLRERLETLKYCLQLHKDCHGC
jgi:hypothetical protein